MAAVEAAEAPPLYEPGDAKSTGAKRGIQGTQ